MAPFYHSSLTKARQFRSASLAIALFGAATNLVFTLQVLAAWRSLKWEPESEWEASMGKWTIDGVKLIWILLLAYFASAASVSTAGCIGIVKNRQSLVRAYRDYSIVDFSFCTFFTLLATYAAFQTSTRAGVCEELSLHPELLRDVLEMGLSLENCEVWIERAILVFVASLAILTVIRLYFVLAVSRYYSQLVRHEQSKTSVLPTYRDIPNSDVHQQKILLLPRTSSEQLLVDSEEPIVYAPIPMSTLPPDLARDLRASATEAWVMELRSASSQPTSVEAPKLPRHQHRHHRHQRRHSSRSSDSLPSYEDITLKA